MEITIYWMQKQQIILLFKLRSQVQLLYLLTNTQ